MKRAQVLLRIETGYLRTGFTELKALSHGYEWKDGLGEWLVPIENLPRFAAVLGEPIDILPHQKAALEKSLTFYGKVLDIEGWKGKGTTEITKALDYYLVREYRKSKETGKVYTQETRVPFLIVANLKAIVSGYPILKWVSWETVSRRVCESLNVDEAFRRKTGSWDKEKFQGRRGAGYFRYWHYPAKVLEAEGYIARGNGRIMRLEE